MDDRPEILAPTPEPKVVFSAPCPDELVDFIHAHRVFAVLGHKEPDGDCVCSQIALGSALERLGKRVVLCSAGPFNRVEIASFAPRFAQAVPDYIDAAFVLDCSNIARIGSLSLGEVPTAFIDHHASNDSAGRVRFIDDKAPSVTIMIFTLMMKLGLEPTADEAELLLFGLCTDSGFFRHLDQSSAAAFDATSRLVAAGASPRRVFSKIYGGRSLESRKLMAETLLRTERYFGGKLLYSSVTAEDQRRYGVESRDSDMLYQLLQNVSGCQAVMIIRQESENECTIGLRSRDPVDVSSVAARHGGGGHRLAAGLMMPGKIEQARDALLQEFESIFGVDPRS